MCPNKGVSFLIVRHVMDISGWIKHMEFRVVAMNFELTSQEHGTRIQPYISDWLVPSCNLKIDDHDCKSIM